MGPAPLAGKKGTLVAGIRDARWLRLRDSSYARRTFYYLVALLSIVIIIAAAASYLVMRNQIGRMAADRSLVDLRRASASFSTMYASSIVAAAEQVFETSEVNRLIYGRTLTSQELLTATRFLDRFGLANPLIDSIVVYNSQRGAIYSTRYGLVASTDSRNAFLMRVFRQIGSRGLYRFIPRLEGDKELLSLIVGSRPAGGGALLGALVVNVSGAAVRSQLFGNLEREGAELTILDGSGTILSSRERKRFGMDAANYPILRRVMAEASSSGSFSAGRGRSASLVAYVREPLAGWTFVSATPARMLFAGIARWRNDIVILFAALLALSMVLALQASRQVSGPIDRLLEKARSLQGDLAELPSGVSGRDDILLVSETLDLLSRRLQDLSAARRLEQRTRRRAFTRLLHDQAITAKERSELRRSLFDSVSGEVWILAMAADGIESHGGGPHRATMLAACRELGRRLAESPAVLAAGESDRGIVAAAVARDGASFRLPPALSSAVEEATPFGCSFTVGISDPVSTSDELASAYGAALEAVRYRFRSGCGSVILQSDTCVAAGACLLPEEDLRRLGEYARLVDTPAVEATLHALLAEVLPYSYEDFVFRSQSIFHAFERVFAESGVLEGAELAKYRSYVLDAKWIETVEEVEELALHWYRTFASRVREQSGQRLNAFVADVKAVIDESLFDPDLSAKRIAARMKISVNYVRSTFKSATGESIAPYITRLRLERCKKLLERTGLPVKEVAEAVGFRNYTYFFTLFKKQTGKTPQEYQRRLRVD